MLRSDLAESIRICKKNGALFVRFFHVSSPLLDLKVSSKSSPIFSYEDFNPSLTPHTSVLTRSSSRKSTAVMDSGGLWPSSPR